MNRSRLITLALIGAIVVLAVLGWVVGVAPLLAQSAAADSQREGVASVNDTNEIKVAKLKVQISKISTLQADLTKLRASVPENTDIPVFLREINTYCVQYGVTLTSVTVADPEDFIAPVTAAAGVAAAPSATSTPTPSAPGASAAAPVSPVTNGLVVIPVKVIVSGPYASVMAFVGALQAGPRLILMSQLGVGPTLDGVSAIMDIRVYALPLTGGAAALAEAEKKASTATPTPAPTGPAPSPNPTDIPTDTATPSSNG